ncbi:hypothetical protein PRZ48_015102 [Zasmidium cellare]|uniref:Brl1/Brr6 domain-containing protein n=1 Tax=Zasmidium cellare TaxID=395010 RepID=A0ABR0DY98_ZASCE|nr:hypothetical protein PRZ48_015102 [Zasmidium cellare]
MAQRGNEMGMDYEWQNKHGPMDSRSPFAQLSQNPQRFPIPAQTPGGKRRNHSAFDSPQKQSTPSLRTSPTKPLPPVPAFNNLYSTPRKVQNDFDDSSAGETPKSPEHTDNDATPDTMGRSMLSTSKAVTKYDGVDLNTLSPSKEKERPQPSARRESFFGKIRNKFYSPGRGEVPRADHIHNTDKRVKKRRDRELQRHVSRRRRHSVSDSGDESEMLSKSPRKAQQGDQAASTEKKPHWLSSLFTFIAQHPTVPHILSFYAQLAFNVFLLAGCAYVIYCFWSAVQGDVDKKSHEAMVDIMAEMAVCAENFRKNNCERATRVPALESVCDNWTKCMNQDPSKVGRAKVSAHTFAEIFNSFVEPISWKAMIFTALIVFGCFATTNFAFGFFRDKTANAGAQYHPSYYQQPPPPTPQRTFSNEAYYGTPWHQPPMGLEPAPSGGFAQIEGRGSPVRRLHYN